LTQRSTRAPRLPPRWFVIAAWRTHRAFYRLSGGRLGLWRPKGEKWGTLRLTTIGRRSGKERSAILGYYEDGPNLVTLAMNGWADGDPA
jgi:F420H(2)-dependent quinone reductase